MGGFENPDEANPFTGSFLKRTGFTFIEVAVELRIIIRQGAYPLFLLQREMKWKT